MEERKDENKITPTERQRESGKLKWIDIRFQDQQISNSDRLENNWELFVGLYLLY